MLQFCCALLVVLLQVRDRPLPDAKAFIEEFRKTLHEDSTLLREYTYTETTAEMTLDSKGKVKKTETNVYQVLNDEEEWKTYRRHISRNDVPLTEKELSKQDQQEQERIAKEGRKRAKESETRRQQEKAKAERKEREILDEVFAMYDIQLVRREAVSGIAAIVVTFKAKPNYKPKTSEARMMQHIAGRAWIAEDDRQLIKLEAEVIDSISMVAGLLAKLHKGSTVVFERRKINNEIWLPARAEFLINARVLLLKGINEREVIEYSDYKKYTVDSILTFGEVADDSKP